MAGADVSRVRHAAALIGPGSEVVGFDDEMSHDHDWGPRVEIILTEADYAANADNVTAAFKEMAPETFLDSPGDARRGLLISTLEALLDRTLALRPGEPSDLLGWLALSEQRLLTLTAGAVFRDDDGRLSEVRRRLAWFPDDVWAYKLACQWRRIAEEQAFVGRAGLTGDDIGSRVIAARLVRDIMRLAFLLERRYAPYPKWFGAAFGRLDCAAALSPILARALAAADWRGREAALAEAGLLVGRLHGSAGAPGAFEPRIGGYFSRPFDVINADEIVQAIRASIEDPVLSALPTIGSLDQITDATPVIQAPHRARRAMAALLGDGYGGGSTEA